MSSAFRFYDPDKVSRVTRNRVPHFEQTGATYFITFRLMDSVPPGLQKEFMREKREWLAAHTGEKRTPDEERDYHRKFTGRYERWLDRGYGACLLGDTQNAMIVEDCMRYFEGERSLLHSWVVMPNHVHSLVSMVGDMKLGDLLHSWKGFSARQINQRMENAGSLWQKSYFDRMIRDWDHFVNCARYIRNNPVKAKLPHGGYVHGESEIVGKLLGVAASGPP